MHELSIAESIVQAAGAHAGGRRVRRVQVKVGELARVAPAALAFAFDLAAEGTPLAGAALEVEVTQGSELLVEALELDEQAAE